jgi:hypothetical protein
MRPDFDKLYFISTSIMVNLKIIELLLLLFLRKLLKYLSDYKYNVIWLVWAAILSTI